MKRSRACKAVSPFSSVNGDHKPVVDVPKNLSVLLEKINCKKPYTNGKSYRGKRLKNDDKIKSLKNPSESLLVEVDSSRTRANQEEMINSSQSHKGRGTKIEGVIKTSANCVLENLPVKANETGVPWMNFQPFSPQQTSWMLQEIFNQNKIMMEEMFKNKHIPDVSSGHTSQDSLPDEDEAEPETEKEEDVGEEEEEEGINEESNEEMKGKENEKAEEENENGVNTDDEIKFPLPTMAMLNKLEEKIRKNNSATSRLITKMLLELPGNENVQNFIASSLNHVMTVDLAVQFTYSGKAPLRSFQLLLLCELVKRTVKKKFPEFNESLFGERVRLWLSGCKRKHMKQTKAKQ